MMTSQLRSFERFAHRGTLLANAIGTSVVLVMVVVVNFDVVARSLFNAPFHGAVELVQFSMVLIVFLQLPDVVRAGRLTRSDGFLIIAASRYPRFSAALRRVIDGISAVFMALVAIAMWPEFVEMWESQDYFGIPGVFTAPWWPIKLVIFSSAVFCSLIFSLKALLSVPPADNPDADKNIEEGVI